MNTTTPQGLPIKARNRRRTGPVGLLVVHGIGEQEAGATRDQVVAGLELAYPCPRWHSEDEVQVRPAPAVGPQEDDRGLEVRVYEVYWKNVLSGPAVRGSFNISLPQQLVWFPLLNWLRIPGFAHDYPRRVSWGWTAVLVPLGALITAAYYPLKFLSEALQDAVNKPRESDALAKLAARQRRSELLERFFNALRKDPEAGKGRGPLDRWLDDYFGDIFNYVSSAGKAAPWVPEAANEIYDIFRKTLKRAVDDGCSEIQILAHSLGTVITYHALTTYRNETERLIAVEATQDERPPLTCLFTIGSPLEKFRFFWPKLIELDRPAEAKPTFEWHNFNSPGDVVAGPLMRYDWVSKVRNHSINRAGGLLDAHTGYRRHPSFLQVVGPSLTGEKTVEAGWTQDVRRVLGGAAGSILIPLAFIAIAAAGVAYMYFVGWLSGLVLGKAVLWAGEGLSALAGSSWTLHVLVSEWSPRVLGALIPTVLIPVALALSYLKARDLHESFWRRGFAMERRRTVATKKSPYKDPLAYGFLVAQLAILTGIGWIGVRAGPDSRFSRAQAWFLILALMTAFAIVAGRGITGYWRGIFIDGRYKMSLSRLQLLAWTLVILSTIVTAMLTNHAFGSQSPLSIEVPPELWVLLGITTASAVASPAVMSTKRDKAPDRAELNKTVRKLDKSVKIDRKRSGMIVYNASPEDARWGDILMGDESGNASTVDLGKLQMFFFTFVLVLGYGVAIGRLFETTVTFAELPPIDDSMNTILGISHTGYLANKTVAHSKEGTEKTKAAASKRASGGSR